MRSVYVIVYNSAKNKAASFAKVEIENQLIPEKDENGYRTFVTDKDFKVLQLTDIHIGAGYMTVNKDAMALNAVAAMITAEKPDLVIVTGDICTPQRTRQRNEFRYQIPCFYAHPAC